jgi:hypothetical protein
MNIGWNFNKKKLTGNHLEEKIVIFSSFDNEHIAEFYRTKIKNKPIYIDIFHVNVIVSEGNYGLEIELLEIQIIEI